MRRPVLRLLLSFVLAALVAASHGQARRADVKEEQAAPGPVLEAANEEARAAYKAARDHLLADAGPVVLFDGEVIIFRYGSHRRVTRTATALYDDLKTVGHIVMGLHALV